ncbi:hypothetical protein MXD63_38750, partial [Frankia sp. Cpl3]|nr:hypothetical protein [Frankia sp. Cpl3]
ENGGETAGRKQQIAIVNRVLEPIADEIAREHPGIGVGYYSEKLDAIITYGPSVEMNQHVGRAIPKTHPGRQVMQSGKLDVVIGEQVRGNIMNAMYPLRRGGNVIGYVWANELMTNIDVQLAGMRQGIFAILAIGCMVAAAASGLLIHRLEVMLAEIKTGLRQLSRNLS